MNESSYMNVFHEKNESWYGLNEEENRKHIEIRDQMEENSIRDKDKCPSNNRIRNPDFKFIEMGIGIRCNRPGIPR